ncbi:hypothetical protein HDU98_009600, partial [Podochytrium sp. JEL0797]
MTPELCAQMVSAKPWLVTKIGFFNGDECFYGYQLPGAPQVPSRNCVVSCPGDSSQVCGGAYNALTNIAAISVYTIPTTKTPRKFYPSAFAGCASSTVFTQVSTNDRMTPELCAQD